MREHLHRCSHSSNVLDPKTLLDQLYDHLELAALASVSGVRDRDGLRGLIIDLLERCFVF